MAMEGPVTQLKLPGNYHRRIFSLCNQRENHLSLSVKKAKSQTVAFVHVNVIPMDEERVLKLQRARGGETDIGRRPCR